MYASLSQLLLALQPIVTVAADSDLEATKEAEARSGEARLSGLPAGLPVGLPMDVAWCLQPVAAAGILRIVQSSTASVSAPSNLELTLQLLQGCAQCPVRLLMSGACTAVCVGITCVGWSCNSLQ